MDHCQDTKRDQAASTFIERVARDGYRATKVGDVCRAAEISTRDFYRWFGSKDQCFLTVFHKIGRKLLGIGVRACREENGSWEDKLRVALEVVIENLVRNPPLARFLMEYQAVDGGNDVLWTLVTQAERVYLNDDVRERASSVPESAQEGIVTSAIVEPVIRYLEEDKLHELPVLVPWIVYYATLHVFGPERAEPLFPRSA